jgi:hypothetical protein
MATILSMQERIMELERQNAELKEQLRWRSLDEKPDPDRVEEVLISFLFTVDDDVIPEICKGWWDPVDQCWLTWKEFFIDGDNGQIPNPQGWMPRPAPIPAPERQPKVEDVLAPTFVPAYAGSTDPTDEGMEECSYGINEEPGE